MASASKREKREKKLLGKEEIGGESIAKLVFQIKTQKERKKEKENYERIYQKIGKGLVISVIQSREKKTKKKNRKIEKNKHFHGEPKNPKQKGIKTKIKSKPIQQKNSIKSNISYPNLKKKWRKMYRSRF